jgi:two-component system OmpR family sensor kinase/two-component system sensor histidine kinase BaeS
LGFLVVFGVFTIFLTTAILAVLFLIEGRPPLGLHRPGAWLGAACLVPLVFFALVFTFGGLAFRRFGTPLADVMAAADAVADGDLEVRLREDTPGELGRLAQSFNRMTAELARTEQQRRNLTADVAHELRTPLHIIQGNLEGILDGVYEPDSEHISATLEETRLLARLVNDLQTLSLAEAGQLPLHKVKIAAADLLEDVAASFSGQATEQGIALQVEIDPSVQIPEFSADPDRLDQVLSNLVANALRYTPQGGRIVLRARQLPEGVRLEVQDTGAGVAPEDLPYLFDRFWRGDRSRTRAGGAGSGLGLAIAKQLVQAHGGRIGVESRLGEGTTFRIDMALGDG